MAQTSKSRINKKPSSTSYASTLTTLVFIALCVFGVWMLTSNSIVTPKTLSNDNVTTRTTIDSSEATNDFSSNEDANESNTKSSSESLETNNNNNKNAEDSSDNTTTERQEQKDTAAYGDNPGHLPDDAIKSDANTNANIGNDQRRQESAQISSSEESSLTQEQSTSKDASERSQKEGEENIGAQDESSNTKAKQSIMDTHEGSKSNKEEEKNRRKSGKSSKKEEKKTWSTQADESQSESERQKNESSGSEESQDLEWSLCNVTAGADFIPCLDNEKYLRHSHRKHYEHRERHCPEDAPTCLVPLPKGYKTPIQWPSSREKIWYHNVPHTKLAEVKGHQNWVKLTGEFLTFPGGGTQFIHGALHYIDFLQQAEPGIEWGKQTRVILDVGCGVGSFGGYLFERDVIAMSLAPKDEHEAQVQFALERGIPAISAVMGTQRLQFPGRVFDLVHCARCRVPWHADGGLLLLELNRLLRPGGYFVWSATPVYQTLEEDVEIWKQMTSLTKAMCWELVTINKDGLNQVGAAFYRKPISNECYEQREQNEPPMCKDDDDPNAAWYVPLQACIHKLDVGKSKRGVRWPEVWPSRLHKAPYWLNNSQVGIHGKPVSQEFVSDDGRWKNVVDELSNIGVSWSNVRNVMDMRTVYGGFAAALRDLQVWVFNVVNIDSLDTLPIIYERGLIGIYHDWCESFSTYPRTYDLLHADHLFSKLKNRCKLVPVIAEVDRIVRPGGYLIVRDEPNSVSEVEDLLKSLHWEITLSKDQEGVLFAKKGKWRPNTFIQIF